MKQVAKSSARGQRALVVEPDARRREPLRDCVEHALELYFQQLNGHATSGLYQMVLAEVEPPLLKTVMKYTQGNQTHAAEILGISRSTLRKKLAEYRIG